MLVNMRKSKQRDLILEIVENNNIHPTAEWVYGEAKKKMPTIGIATVYRNLNLLVELGKLERISIPGESDRYDAVTHTHFHMRCKYCGKLIDIYPVDDEAIPKLKEAISRNFNLKGTEFEISEAMLSCVCNQCADIENKNQNNNS